MRVIDLINPGNPTGTGWQHSGAGDTEVGAARANPKGRLNFRAKLLAAYEEVGAAGLTDPEAQELTGMSLPGDAGARRHELVALGHPIVDSGQRRLSPRGKPCIVWVLETNTNHLEAA